MTEYTMTMTPEFEAMLREAHAVERTLKRPAEKLVNQYLKGLMTLDELTEQLFLVPIHVAELAASHEDGRHENGAPEDEMHWAVSGCRACHESIWGTQR